MKSFLIDAVIFAATFACWLLVALPIEFTVESTALRYALQIPWGFACGSCGALLSSRSRFGRQP